MSAKINIVTDDQQLATYLAAVIAHAIQDAGFTNTQAKSINVQSVSLDDPSNWEQLPPQLISLGTMRFTDDDLFPIVTWRAPEILNEPIVLSNSSLTCPEYEESEMRFLNSGKPSKS